MHRWLDIWMNTYALKGCWKFCLSQPTCAPTHHRAGGSRSNQRSGNYSAFMMGRGQWSSTQLSASLQNCSPPTWSWLKQNQTWTVVPWPKPAAQQQRGECVDMGNIPLDTREAKNMTRSGASVAKYSIKLEIYAPPPPPHHPQFPGISVLSAHLRGETIQTIQHLQ